MINVVSIRVHTGEPFEKALRRFKRQCKQEGIIVDLKRKEYHLKPSELRRRKLVKAKRRG